MCGRYTLAGPDPATLRARFPLGERVELRRRYNVAPGDDVAAVTADRAGTPRGDILRWGLVPHWADSPKTGLKMINARAETVAERPAFRDALARRRCLVVADGFYEWQRHDGPRARRHAWWITRADGRPFAFAGLWALWRDASAGDAVEPLRSCAIVTTAANGVVAPLHDRMPVMLPAGAEATWLDPATPQHVVRELLVAPPDAETAARRVGDAVNDARHDEPDCLEPPGAEEAEPEPAPTLF